MASVKSTADWPGEVILAVNSGSSSLKLGFFERADGDEQVLFTGLAENIGRGDGHLRLIDAQGNLVAEIHNVAESHQIAFVKLIELTRPHLSASPSMIGHRVVHGGPSLTENQPITDDLLQTLDDAVHFAPLHIPTAIALIRQSQSIFPNAFQIACFDTAFHQALPEVSRRLPIPATCDAAGIRRYGFHGLSYESVVHRLGERLPERTIVAHLGNGSSLCALHKGRPIDTTMGLTPTGGIPMATRSGDLDPGILLFLMRTQGLNADQLESMLNDQSGMAALSGGETDMRRLLGREAAGDHFAGLAIEAFVLAVRKVIGAYAALLSGLDLLVLTGGIGEHSTTIRSRICRGMQFVQLSDDPACSHILVLPSEEERQIARICRLMVQTGSITARSNVSTTAL